MPEDTAALLDEIDDLLGGPDAMQRVLQRTFEALRATNGTIHLLEADGALHLRARGPLPPELLGRIRVIPVGRGMAGLAVERRAPVSTCNLQTDATGDVRPGARMTGLAGSVCVPILRANGADEDAVGALGVGVQGERDFTPAETELLLAIGRRIGARAHEFGAPPA